VRIPVTTERQIERMHPALSICIPTYNRAPYLRTLLQSVVAELGPIPAAGLVEVVISDNNSNDDTELVVNDFVAEYRSKVLVNYLRQKQNVGPARNLISAVANARGDYVWLMGDDDMFVNNSILNVLDFVSENRRVEYIFVPRGASDKHLQIYVGRVQPSGVENTVLYESGRELFSAFGGQMPEVLGFYGSTVIRKERWRENATYLEPLTQWSHLRLLLYAIRDLPCAILGKEGVIARVGNAPRPVVMTKIWLDDYIDIFIFARNVGYDARLCESMIKLIVISFSKAFVVDKAMGARGGSVFSVLRLRGMAVRWGYINLWAILSAFPYWLLAPVWRIYRMFRPSSWDIGERST